LEYIKNRRFVRNKKAKALSREVDKLKKNSNKIKVLFDECEIKTREDFAENPGDSLPPKVEMLDALYDPERGYHQTKRCVSVLIFTYRKPGGDAMAFRSELIYMPLENLRLYLDNKKYTFIYFDPKNYSKYFFDMDFLNGQIPV
jgi:hypothetical protein